VSRLSIPPHPPLLEMAGFEPARPRGANTCLPPAGDEPLAVTAGVQGALPTGRRSREVSARVDARPDAALTPRAQAVLPMEQPAPCRSRPSCRSTSRLPS
jgi:hypothetical protein